MSDASVAEDAWELRPNTSAKMVKSNASVCRPQEKHPIYNLVLNMSKKEFVSYFCFWNLVVKLKIGRLNVFPINLHTIIAEKLDGKPKQL